MPLYLFLLIVSPLAGFAVFSYFYYRSLEGTLEKQRGELQTALDKLTADKALDDALLGSLGEGIVVTNSEGNIVLINHKAEKLVGWSNTEVINKRWSDIVPLVNAKGEVIPPDHRATQRVLKEGKPITSDKYFYVRRDGTKFQVGTTAAPVVLNNEIIGAIAVFRDVTREKEVDRAKSEFVSLASHQLRTPLSAIKWFSEMLLSGDAGGLTAEQHEFVENISQSNERMIELVNSLLNISRIESGRIIIDPVLTDLGNLVNEVLEEVKLRYKDKKHEWVVSVHPGLPQIKIDPKLIYQVYMNLLTNSAKYTAEGGKIVVLISQKDKELVSQITDNGYGIPKDQQTKIFEKFFRGENIQKLETDGTGLGLYLVKAIVESSGGRIWFQSEETKGTSFWFSLPVAGSTPKAGEVTLT